MHILYSQDIILLEHNKFFSEDDVYLMPISQMYFNAKVSTPIVVTTQLNKLDPVILLQYKYCDPVIM